MHTHTTGAQRPAPCCTLLWRVRDHLSLTYPRTRINTHIKDTSHYRCPTAGASIPLSVEGPGSLQTHSLTHLHTHIHTHTHATGAQLPAPCLTLLWSVRDQDKLTHSITHTHTHAHTHTHTHTHTSTHNRCPTASALFDSSVEGS